MVLARRLIGILLCLVGAVWIAQGLNVLHGSGMSGHAQYAVLGVLVFLVGFAVVMRTTGSRSR